MATALQRIAAHVPGLQFHTDPLWSSQNGNPGRELIRGSLIQHLDPEPRERETLMKLENRPHLEHWRVSVSHCPELGGWAAIPAPARPHVTAARLAPEQMSIGFDVEVADRISRKVVERVASDEELQAAPDPLFLWTAKEATYKAIPSEKQPAVVSDPQITGWRQVAKDLYQFTADQPGTGWFCAEGPLHFSIFVRN